MGYTHNWATRLPANPRHLQGELELMIRACGVGHNFEITRATDGALLLQHHSGEAEDFYIGREDRGEYDQSCKTGRGAAEIDIAEVLWRSAIAITDAGGHMQLYGDWIGSPSEIPLNGFAPLTIDAQVALAVLVHRCADLLVGRKLSALEVPREWGVRAPVMWDDATLLTRRMMHGARTTSTDRLVFGLDQAQQPDHSAVLAPGSLYFQQTVSAHSVQACDFDQAPVLRGFLYSDAKVWLDGKLLAGPAVESPFAGHPQVISRTTDLCSRVQGTEFLRGLREGRLEYSAMQEAE